MNIFLSKNARSLLKAISREVRRRKADGADYRRQQNFNDGPAAKALLAPETSPEDYEQAVRELYAFGFIGRAYIRGGFLLSNRGIDAALHSIRFFLLANRSEILSVLALVISIISLIKSLSA